MDHSRSNWSGLNLDLGNIGLSIFGGVEIVTDDCPDGAENFAGYYGFLIGNGGAEMWDFYSESEEHKNSVADSMDQWTRRVVSDLANNHQVVPVFPFEKPYWPFQRFAKRAGHGHSSPLGIVIHPEYGLWHGFRAMLLFAKDHSFASQISGLLECADKQIHPCDSCLDKPCLSACPVGAFNGTTLERERCDTHLQSGQEPNCMMLGCRARDACPVGLQFRYSDNQIRFHMKAFAG